MVSNITRVEFLHAVHKLALSQSRAVSQTCSLHVIFHCIAQRLINTQVK